MKRMMVRYKVNADRDGVSFFHLVSLETADGRDPLREPPAAVTPKEVASYGFFGE
jgi:hypothetical protein